MTKPVAIVTGAARGIGRETALALAAAGYHLVLNDADVSVAGQPEVISALDTVVTEIEATGNQALPFRGSVTDEATVAEMFAAAVETFGQVDVLVNNAGIARDQMIFNMSVEDWDAVITTSLRGTFLCSRELVRQLRSTSRPGMIINLTSASGMFGNIGQTNYSAARSGILGFTMTLAHETRRLGIVCVAVAPWARTRLSDTISGESPDAVRRKAYLTSLDPRYVGSGIAAIARANDPNLSGKVVGIRGREIIVFDQMTRLATGIADAPGTSDDFAARLDDLRAGLGQTPSAGDVFSYAPPL